MRLRNPHSGSHIFNRQSHRSDNHYYYAIIIYYMFISDINLILAHYQPTVSLQEGSLSAGGRRAERAPQPWLCLCTFCAAAPLWLTEQFPRDREWPQTPHYLISFVCLVETWRGGGAVEAVGRGCTGRFWTYNSTWG